MESVQHDAPQTQVLSNYPSFKPPLCETQARCLYHILAIATIPFLSGLLAIKAGGEFLQSVGSDSEEIFRGDRLPILPFPHHESPISHH
jgi:hypothetical protein